MEQKKRLEIADLLRQKTFNLKKQVERLVGITASAETHHVGKIKRAVAMIDRASSILARAPENEIHENLFTVESIYGGDTRRGLVRISFGLVFDETIAIDDAQALAVSIIEAATAAETDEILLTFFRDRIGIGDRDKLAAMLIDFRSMRDFIRERNARELKENK